MLSRIEFSILVLGIAARAGFGDAVASEPIAAQAKTKHFRLELRIGEPERMYTRAEAAKLHPQDGEIMVGGAMGGMAMTGGSSMPGDASPGMPSTKMPMRAATPGSGDHAMQHLEVHILSKRTGQAIRHAEVEIRVENTKTRHHELVPIAVMYGVQEGASDWHYGNNVNLPPGPYRIDVLANGERASFDTQIPAP